jgi:hypothetical protein
MGVTTKNKKQLKSKKTNKVIIDPGVKNYGKHPFFVKKAREMKTLLDHVGLPPVLNGQK